MKNWKRYKLGDLTNSYAGGTPSRDRAEYFGGSIPWIKSTEINHKKINATEETISEQGYKSSSAKWIPAFSVLIAMYGATAAQVSFLEIEATANQAVLAVVPSDKLDARFLFHLLTNSKAKLLFLAQGSGQPNLNKKIVDDLIIHLPSLAEQTTIAAILSTIDQAIAQTEAIIAKQQRIKTGLMQDLLTKGIDEAGNVRSEATHEFKDSAIGRIPVEWEVTPAEELCISVIDCKNRTPPPTNEGHPVIRTPNVRNGEFVFVDLAYTDFHSYEIWTARGKPRPGDVVITREAPFGEACQIPEDLSDSCLGQRMMMYQPDPKKLRSDYLVYAIYSEAVQSKLLEIAGGSTVGHVRVGDIRKLLIPHPISLDEQTIISETLVGASNILKKESYQQHKLSSLKTGLMQDLLTGKVQVTDLLNSTPPP